MTPLYEEALKHALEDLREHDETISPPLTKTKAEVDQLFRSALGFKCDPDFFAFCQRCNGLRWDGLIVYGIFGDGSENDVIQNNLDWRESGGLSRFIVYGDTGMDLLAAEPSVEQFNLLMKPSFDTMESYSSFDEMLSFELNNHL